MRSRANRRARSLTLGESAFGRAAGAESATRSPRSRRPRSPMPSPLRCRGCGGAAGRLRSTRNMISGSMSRIGEMSAGICTAASMGTGRRSARRRVGSSACRPCRSSVGLPPPNRPIDPVAHGVDDALHVGAGVLGRHLWGQTRELQATLTSTRRACRQPTGSDRRSVLSLVFLPLARRVSVSLSDGCGPYAVGSAPRAFTNSA